MTSKVRLITLAALALLLGGCYFDHPLTSFPSKNINSWVLGVWQHTGADGRVAEISVVPLACDKYTIKATIPGTKANEVKKYEFTAWPSRVGDTTFLNLQCVSSPGDIPQGKFIFFQTQLLDQNNLRLHRLVLDVAPSTSSFEIRKQVRAKNKSRTLYDAKESTDWKRIEEAVWKNNGSTSTFAPIRNPTF